MDLLLAGPQAVNDLVSASGLSQPVVSKHLRVLREANMVAVTPMGQQRLYRLSGKRQMRDLEAWLEPYRRHWAERLDALEDYLDNQ